MKKCVTNVTNVTISDYQGVMSVTICNVFEKCYKQPSKRYKTLQVCYNGNTCVYRLCNICNVCNTFF